MNNLETDFFTTCDVTGDQFAGKHILVDLWQVSNMDNLNLIQETLEQSAIVAGATILHSYYHPFGEEMGVSGVTVLSESHISIHTWPERQFAAIDIFMCGKCDPKVALDYIIKSFKPGKFTTNTNSRGLVSNRSLELA
jgi:S-adenosylmethionine decarboxylase